MSSLANKHIILGVTGGIAAYKSAEIVRQLRDRGATVRVVMTENAKAFITPLTLQAVSHNPVHDNLLDEKAEAAMSHIELARWADIILIAPATANCLAQLAQGKADDLLSTLCLASRANKALAPAMNQQMWHNEATQANVALLKQRNFIFFGPDEGAQACGDVGIGRMMQPEQMTHCLEKLFASGILAGIKVLITAGPTREPIDPIRFISNRSSGKMGYALAEACVEAGAIVTLISGPVALTKPQRVEILCVETAEQMFSVAMAKASECDIFIAAAAVADYAVKQLSQTKIKKQQQCLHLELTPNADIVKTVAQLPVHRPFVVGFAAETHNLMTYAKKKLIEKNLDMIIANEVGDADRGFESDQNAANILWHQGEMNFPLMRKPLLARELIKIIAKHYHEKNPIKNS